MIVRVLLIHDYAHLGGGAEVLTGRIRSGLRARGHDARLLASNAAGGAEADYLCEGSQAAGLGRVLNQTYNRDAARQLRRVLREFQPDVIHVRMCLTQMSPAILPVLAGTAAIYHAVWYESICPKGTRQLPDGAACPYPAGVACLRERCLPPLVWAPMMAQLAMFRRWRGVFKVIAANSRHVARQLEAAGFGPVDMLWNAAGECVARPPLSDDRRPHVVFAGRLVREKGADLLIDAFAQVAAEFPLATLTIAGDGPEHATLARQCEMLGLGADRVRFAGHVPHAQIEALTEQAWVQVVPSRWSEPFGLVAPEAMMRGVAVIASGAGGLAEIAIDGETGYLFEPGNVAGLASSLRRVLRSRELAEALGTAGRARAMEHFHPDVFLDGVLALYAKALTAVPRVSGS